MNYAENLLTSFREQVQATVSRSDILKPVAWLIGIVLTAVVGAAWGKAPEWLLIMLVCFLGVSILLYLFSYCFCLVKDRDALRSEKYILNKMAIEHGLLGDNIHGVIESKVAPRVVGGRLPISQSKSEAGA